MDLWQRQIDRHPNYSERQPFMPDFTSPIQRRPAGRAIRRTADERAKVAAVTQADILAGRLLWVATAPGSHKGMLEARVEPERGE